MLALARVRAQAVCLEAAPECAGSLGIPIVLDASPMAPSVVGDVLCGVIASLLSLRRA